MKNKYKKLISLHPEASSEIIKLVDNMAREIACDVVDLPNLEDIRNELHEHLEDLFVVAFVLGQTSALDKLRKLEEEIEEEDNVIFTTVENNATGD